jgi:hypothetical protein
MRGLALVQEWRGRKIRPPDPLSLVMNNQPTLTLTVTKLNTDKLQKSGYLMN